MKEFYRKQGVQTEYPHGGGYEEIAKSKGDEEWPFMVRFCASVTA